MSEREQISMKPAAEPADAAPSPGLVKIHIEELVLHGFPRADRHRIASAVESELARLMGEGNGLRWQQSPPSIERINGGAIKITPGAKPQAAGTQIARAVFRGLRQHARASGVRGGGR